MPSVQDQQVSDIEIFAKAYHGIELTSFQKDVIRHLAGGGDVKFKRLEFRRNVGKTQAITVMLDYVKEGLKPSGRVRMPKQGLPVQPKLKGLTQEGKVLAMIKRPGGAYNFQLSRIALKYTSVISELRKEGHEIVAEPQYNKHGKRTNTYLYRIAGQL